MSALKKQQEQAYKHLRDKLNAIPPLDDSINVNSLEGLAHTLKEESERIKKELEGEEIIDKACEYLRTHLFDNTDADNDPIVESVANLTKDEFIKDFRNYMKYGKQN